MYVCHWPCMPSLLFRQMLLLMYRWPFLIARWCVNIICSELFIFKFRKSADNVNPMVQRGLFLFAVSNSCADPIVYGKCHKDNQGQAYLSDLNISVFSAVSVVVIPTKHDIISLWITILFKWLVAWGTSSNHKMFRR